MRRLTPWITCLEEGEETHVKGTEIILNYIIKEKISNLNSQRPTKLQKEFRFYMCRIKKGSPNDTQNLKETLYTQNEEGLLKVQGKNAKSHIKPVPLERHLTFWWRRWKTEGTEQMFLQALRHYTLKSKLLYSTKLSIIIKRERNTFHD